MSDHIDNLKLLRILRVLAVDGPSNTNAGICMNAKNIAGELYPDINRCLVDLKLQALFRDMGLDLNYPVEHPLFHRVLAYEAENVWEGEYGINRKYLLYCLIIELDRRVSERRAELGMSPTTVAV